MKYTSLFTLCLFLLNGLVIHTFAQKQEKVFDKILTELFADKDGPGGTALVVKNGKSIYRKAFGKANLELDVPMQTNHIFRIGSITKQFTACAILKLAEEGKLSLQDDFTKYVKDYPTHGYTITIEHLLTHTSGIKSYTNIEKWDLEAHKRDFTPEEMIDWFKHEPMEFAPGTKFNYNNSAYFLLGYIIEQVADKTYAEYINDTFFKPLGMKNSSYGNSLNIIKNRAAGYQKLEGYKNADFLSMTQPYAAGSLLSTVEDLSIWYHAVNSGKVISKSSLEKAHTNFKLNNGDPTIYGYGWFLGNVQGSPMYEHGGGIHGYLTASIFVPEEELFVAVFSNCTCNGPSDTALKLAATALGKPYAWKKIKVKDKELANYQGVYESTDNGTVTLSFDKGQLYYMQSGGEKTEIYPFAKDKFFAHGVLGTLEINRDNKGQIQSATRTGRYLPMTWQRTDKEIPTIKEVAVSKEDLAKYVGKYQLAPNFIISIIQEGKGLVAQATGQPKIKIIPIAAHKFVLVNVDAQLLFHLDDAGKTTSLTLFQNGEHPAQRIE